MKAKCKLLASFYKFKKYLPFITQFQNLHLLRRLEDFAGDGLGRPAEYDGFGVPFFASTVLHGRNVAGGGSAPGVVAVTQVVGIHFQNTIHLFFLSVQHIIKLLKIINSNLLLSWIFIYN